MPKPSIISSTLSIAVASTAVVLIPLLSGCASLGKDPSPDDLVTAVVEPETIPEGLLTTLFQDLDIIGLVLVDKDERIRAFTSDGTPVDLCYSLPRNEENGRDSCELQTTTRALITDVSNARYRLSGDAGYKSARRGSNKGTCFKSAGGTKVTCHRDNRKWYYHDRGSHHNCVPRRCR